MVCRSVGRSAKRLLLNNVQNCLDSSCSFFLPFFSYCNSFNYFLVHFFFNRKIYFFVVVFWIYLFVTPSRATHTGCLFFVVVLCASYFHNSHMHIFFSQVIYSIKMKINILFIINENKWKIFLDIVVGFVLLLLLQFNI